MSRLHDLNLDGWTTTATTWWPDRLEVTAEFVGPTTCPQCGSTGPFGRDSRKPQRYTDLPFLGLPVKLTVRRWRLQCRCGFRPMQDLPDIATGIGTSRLGSRKLTKRCLRLIEDECFSLSFEDIEARYGICSNTVRDIFKIVAERLEKGRRILAPARIGIDEKWIDGDYRTVIVDITPKPTQKAAKPGLKRASRDRSTAVERNDGSRILDILPDRHEATIVEWWRTRLINAHDVKIVAMDRFDEFRRAVRAVSNATIVFDRWHIGQTITSALRDERARSAVLAWHAIWNLQTKAEAELAWIRWEADLSEEVKPKFAKFLDVLHNWHDEVLAYWDDRVTTSAVERYNGNLKEIIVASRGGRFDMIRARGLDPKRQPNRDRRQCPGCLGYFGAADVRITSIDEPDEDGAMTMHMACLECAPYPPDATPVPPMIWLSEECWGPEGGLGAS